MPVLTTAPAARLTFADDAFLRRHRGLGCPVVNQFVWRFDTALPAGTAESLAAELARGAFGRRAVRSLVPGARGRWLPEPDVPAVEHGGAAVDDLGAWVTERAAADLDPAVGPAWRVATTDLVGGGCAVSLVVSHAVADGSAMVDAVRRAAAGAEPLAVATADAGPRALAGDLLDAAGQVAVVTRWGLRAAVGAVRGRRTPGGAGPTPAAAAGLPHPDWAPSWLVGELSSAQVREVARAHGGTTNAWFVAVVAGLVRRTGRALGPDGVRVALPVSTRGVDDPRGNATRIARVAVPVPTLEARDLGGVRASCKTAYVELDRAVEPVPLALVQMLPDRLFGRLPPPPAAAALASNLGAAPGLGTLGGVTARSVAALAHQPGLGVAEATASGGGLVAFLCDTGERTTLNVVALDPLRVPDRAALRSLVDAELDGWAGTGDALEMTTW